MQYPLVINGKVSGSLRIERDGLYTVMEAESPERGEKLVRLWVHGGGKCTYLGVMQPWSGGLYLSRRLSRMEASAFPAEPEWASDTGEVQTEKNREAEEAPNARMPACTEEREKADGLLWFQRPDGTLTAHDGVSSLVAIPAELRQVPEGAVVKSLNGQSYMIFRY